MRPNDTVLLEALRELAKEEGVLAEADDNMGMALSRYRIAAKRYPAVRDVIEEMLNGRSPCASVTNIDLPEPSAPDGDYPWSNSTHFGRYRYMFKSIGDAVYEVIRDAEEPLAVVELVSALKLGNLDVTARSVNALLLNLKGVEKPRTDTIS